MSAKKTLEHLNRALHAGLGYQLHDAFLDQHELTGGLVPEDGRLYQFLMHPEAHKGHLTLHPDTGRVVGVHGYEYSGEGDYPGSATFHGPGGLSIANKHTEEHEWGQGYRHWGNGGHTAPTAEAARAAAITHAFPPLAEHEQHLRLHEADGSPARLSRQTPTIRDQAEELVKSGRMPDPASLGHALRQIASHEQPWGAVSSSTRENSSYADALKGLASPAFHALERDTPEGASGIGLWTDGAEETRFLPAPHKDYLLHLASKYKQKAALLFTPGAGEHIHHKLTVAHPVDPGAIASRATALGIPAITILTHGNGTQLHIVDPEGSLTPAVTSLAKETNATYTRHQGHAEFLAPGQTA